MNKTTVKLVAKRDSANKVNEVLVNLGFITCGLYFCYTLIRAMIPLLPGLWALIK